MITYPKLWRAFCTLENLYDAYYKARRKKTRSIAVREFEKHARLNLVTLFREVRTGTYKPRPLKQFVLRDPKTRVISVSDFRDRIVHHMIINVLQPIFESQFIFDSYANRKNKGTHPAIMRAQNFFRAVTKNGKRTLWNQPKSVRGFCLKCDVNKYFETVDHDILISIISRKVTDEKMLTLLQVILANHHTPKQGTGMPLGNWTSQFFANIYLNELDQFVKHEVKAKYYIRYVDDFLIFHHDSKELELMKQSIDAFIRERLVLSLHPIKCRVIPLHRGIPFLGYRIQAKHVLIQKRNLRKLKSRTADHLESYKEGISTKEDMLNSFNGWCAFAIHANTYKLRLVLQQQLESDLLPFSVSHATSQCN